ncbi:MAG: 2,3-diketo-L-gulonate TRAP transporter small permease protein YiaM [Syntrophaceae bacterium PtaU1.Bin231]|nr:MAG: 2,3-diketo-L-gulonate TRAP transporter small permease protein YiaM [Syntrophaceae bacterium PtaU1.Bin231]
MTRCMDMLEAAIRWTIVGLLAVMVVAIGSQVFARYLFHQSLYWTEELGRHVMVWMIFLASVLCVRRGFHLSITLLKERLSRHKQALLQLIGAVVLAYFFYMMIVHGWTLTQKTMVQRSSALHYPMGYVYASLPVSGLLMFIVNLEVMIKAGLEVFGKRTEEAAARPAGTGGESK